MEHTPSPELFTKIMKRIRREEQVLLFKKIAFFATILIASLVAFVPAIRMLIQEAETSGFVKFLSLAFSDFDIIKNYWQTFILTILETLPAISLAFCLAVLLTFLQSIKILSKNIKTVFTIKHLAIN